MKELTEQQMEEICTLLAANRKIEAIKLCREHLNFGLAEAKEFIDALGTDTPKNIARHKNESGGQLQEIEELIYQNKKIQAIKLYRESQNIGLAEAKEFIDALSEELRIKSPEKFAKNAQGCMTSIVFIILICCFLYIC